ncbi:hypothetical protein N7478_001193 [Penicillium angulare]|uniref:uncharacterized protein n=1 Tax=Penicillium angulare TaxID=116970 RepID=UPI002540D843|nr:uncharacterized protein N7478_001193 [Penicillium angulare]KAJ5291942.1 hypothetical protein N7478_001193 [Penicillium angulare]
MSTLSKTCQSCASSKVKCVRSTEDQPKCNRCLRLGKECAYRRSGRRFHGFQKDRQIEALESRVKELMSDRVIASVEPSAPTSHLTSSTRSASFNENDNNENNLGIDDVIKRGLLSIGTARHYLELFKSVLSPNFPFVVISSSISINQLRQERPFLLLAVLASASYDDFSLQRLLGKEVKKAVAARMILGGEISFDMLQGLLVFLAWSHYHSKPNRYTQFLQLAISLVIELRLDRPPQTEEWKTPLLFETQQNLNKKTYVRPSWGTDEKRAVIGCYYLSYSTAVFLHKHSNFPYIPYFDECCRSLDQEEEYPTDKYIVHSFQLQHIAEKINRLSTDHRNDLKKPMSGTELYVMSIKSDLEAFESRLPFKISTVPFLAIQFYATSLCLYQIALNHDQHSEDSMSISQTWRADLSLAGTNAADNMLNLHISLPPMMEVKFTNTQWIQTAFAMLVAYRNTVANNTPTNTISFLHTLSQLRQRVGALSSSKVDMDGQRDVFSGFVKRINQTEERLMGVSNKSSMPTNISKAYENTSMASPSEVSMLPVGDQSLVPMPELFSFPEMDDQFMQGYSIDPSMDQMFNAWF